MKDLRCNTRLFGGAMVLLAGDFRQTLPVIPRSTAADELNACLKASHLWRYVKKIELTTNMRFTLQNDPSADEFSKHERAILAAKNKDIDDVNFIIQSIIATNLHSFKSIDCVTKEDEATNYPIEFLNSLDLPGLPPHNLQLKVGSIIIMLRNLNQPKLCNGTRFAVKHLKNNVIQAMLLKGKFKGEEVLIPRIPMIPTDLPFEFKRIQFRVRVTFAMTINKAQGQSLRLCGLNLEFPCSSHGQLYVACSACRKAVCIVCLCTGQQNKKRCTSYSAALT
ncbi:ATP-dependent DNA helicase PIF6-like [Cephus cinctus]|uniref:ATP-dependent DNA helicase n=1 Tax=Cephus cinctus TaxID=211228 RepID=A0AAJ7W816_CEPCN|nr:ATP-dependent DNA helicase PIF6-like [Cephus cinctus]